MTTVLGVDPSLTSTAVCWIGEDGLPDIRLSRTKPGSDQSTLAKLTRMQHQVGFVCDYARSADVVLIEARSLASSARVGRSSELSGLWWLMLAELVLGVERIGVVPPAVLKKWVTGTGNADKFRVGQHIAKRWPDIELRGDDQSDALGLASMGLHYLDVLPWTPTAYQAEALGKVEWNVRTAIRGVA